MSKKHYDGDSILHRLFSLLFWFTVCGGVCLLIGATLMLGFTTGAKPTYFNDFIGLLVLGTCAFPVLLLALYRSLLYIIYGDKVAYKFKNLWQAAFIPTLLLIVLITIGYFVTIFGDNKENKTILTVLNNNSKTNKNYSNSTTAKPEPPETTIWDAAKLGKIEALKNHLAIGMDVNKLNKYGQTLLHIGAKRKL